MRRQKMRHPRGRRFLIRGSDSDLRINFLPFRFARLVAGQLRVQQPASSRSGHRRTPSRTSRAPRWNECLLPGLRSGSDSPFRPLLSQASRRMHWGQSMCADADRGMARRFADRMYCVRQGHAWETSELTLGEVSLLRSDCARCGQVGRVHSAAHRDVQQTNPAAVG